MSESRQKFEQLTPEGAESQKALKIDEMAGTKDSIQGAAQALSEGKMPSTNQITEAIDSARDSQALRSEVQLSATGQRVADKVDLALDSTKRLIQEKNSGNEIQRLIHHSKLAAKNLDTDGPDYSGETQSAERNLQHAYSNLVILSQLTVTSSEFRGLLADLYNLVRDVLKDNNVPYSKDLPRAEDVTNKDGSLNVGKAKQAASDVASKASDDAYGQLNPEAQKKFDQARQGDGNKVAGDAADTAAQKLGQAVKPIVDKAAEGNTQGASEHAQGKYNKATEEANKMAGEVKHEAGKAADQATQKLDSVMQDLKLSDEQQEHLVDRLRAIVDELQSNREAKRAVNGLFEVLSNLQKNAATAKAKAQEKAMSEVDENTDLREAAANAKKAVENFAGNHSLDKLFKMLEEFSEKVEQDKDLNKIMHDNHQFINKSLKDQKFVHDDNYGKEATQRFEKTRDYLMQKYRQPINSMMNEAQSFYNDLREDPTTNAAIKDLDSLTQELFMDANGKPTIKFDLLKDFQKFIPVLSKRMEQLKIPRVCEQDEKGEYILDNITLACQHVVPKLVRVRTDTEFDTEEDKLKNIVSVKLQGIQAAAKEVAFYFKRKVMIVGDMEDAGLVDVIIDGEGMDIFLKLAPKTVSTGNTVQPAVDDRAFKVLESKCRVNNISVKFQHGKYDILYKMFNKMIQSNIKRQIEKMVGEGLRDFMEGIEQAVSNQNSAIDSKTTESKPLDPRPDGWKSDAFGDAK